MKIPFFVIQSTETSVSIWYKITIPSGVNCNWHQLGENCQVIAKTSHIIASIRSVNLQVFMFKLHWRHNGHDGISNHQPHDCLLNRFLRRRSKKIPKLRVTGLCGAGNSPVTGEFPSQMASNAKTNSIGWRHHASYHGWYLVCIEITFIYFISSGAKYPVT